MIVETQRLSLLLVTLVLTIALRSAQAPELSPGLALEQLRKYRDECRKGYWTRYTPRVVPGYILKSEPREHTQGAEMLAQCIAQYNLNLLGVPRYWPAPYDEHDYAFQNLWEDIQGPQNKEIGLEHIQQLVTLITAARIPYCDAGPDSLVHATDGKIFIVRTHTRHFAAPHGYEPWALFALTGNALAPAAKTFLIEAIKKSLEKYPQHKVRIEDLIEGLLRK